jgi:hypothetical protein
MKIPPISVEDVSVSFGALDEKLMVTSCYLHYFSFCSFQHIEFLLLLLVVV